ncbi:MAG: hypothetical protein K6E21_05485 [Bacilli bacterium]|nr:hypothetical protein [Bacilli bacterium]
MSWLIYKHTNLINGKVYIGQTKQTTSLRWKNGLGYFHKRGLSVFARAIEKYGWENFSHTILDENILNQSSANEREIYWIKHYRSYIGYENSNGYNMTLGGDSGEHLGYPVYQIDIKTLKIINEFPSTGEASRFLDGTDNNASRIRMCCEGRKVSAKGYYWCYKEAYNSSWKPKKNDLVSPVCQINDEMEVIRIFNSITEACNLFGFSGGSIIQCCQRKCRKANGYYWCYESDYTENWMPPEVSFKKNEKIYCFERNETYQNAKDASSKTGINSGSILKCCSHRELNAAGGLHFCFYYERDVYQIKQNSDESPVVCINTGKHYKTISAASLDTGTRYSSISSCCRGVNKTANKLSFCYEKDYNGKNTINKTVEKPIICIETKIKYASSVIAARELGIPRTSLCGALKSHSKTHGLHFCFEDELNNWSPRINKIKKPIKCVETNIIYESAREAERRTGNIFNSLKNGGLAGGFHWKYYDK